jgi:hypothetical protein
MTTPFSRGTTPFSTVSRSTFAGSAITVGGGLEGPPISVDEETEIATLAEVERQIYLGMEALEDAFEALHQKAESVRDVLRQRGAGLALAGQHRKMHTRQRWGGTDIGTSTESETGESESEWGGDDRSELAPDDSASNICSNRRRRPKRRIERRTPAPVEEESEG